jgi:hypothetical protein
MKDFLLPIGTFFAGLFGGLSQHVQKPLTEYRQTLIDISCRPNPQSKQGKPPRGDECFDDALE